MIFLVCIASGFLYVRLFPNLMKEMEEYKGIRTSKIDNFKIQEITSKNDANTEKKRKQDVRQIIYTNHGIYIQKLPLLLTLQTNQSVIQCNITSHSKYSCR